MLCFSNLFPRPDQPGRGLFNLRLFAAMDELMRERAGALDICVPVAEWRLNRHAAIRRWSPPANVSSGLKVQYRPWFYLPGIGRSIQSAFLESALAGLDEPIRKADRLLATWLYPDGVALAHRAARWNKPVDLLVQGSDIFHLRHPLRRRQILAALKTVDRIFCVWRGLGEELIRAGAAADKIRVTPNGVDTGVFRYDPMRARRVMSGGFQVLFVGNLVPVKGPDRMIEAFLEFLRRTPEPESCRLVMIGEGPMRGVLEGRVRGAGQGDRVCWVGRCTPEGVMEWMNGSDVLGLTSRSEGHPNVVSEALACGLPVLAVDVGACRELVGGELGCRCLAGGGRLVGELVEALGLFRGGLVDRGALAERHRGRTWRTMAEELLG